MQKVRVPINSFQYGEVSDSLLMRTDTNIYGQSAQRLENLLVMSEGSVKKRHGLKHIYDYSIAYDASNKDQSRLFRFDFDDNEQYVISVEHQKIRCFQLETSGAVTLVETITADVESNTLPFDKAYLKEYTAAQYGDVMFICHPLFAPRTLIRTSLTSFELDTYAFDTRGDEKVVYQPYSKYQAQNVLLDPTATTGSTVDVRVFRKITESTDAICTEESGLAAGGTFTLDGAAASGGVVNFGGARKISFTSTANASGESFTIAGEDIDGVTISEIVTGPNATTRYSTRFFGKVTSITTSTQLDQTVDVGYGDEEDVKYFDVSGGGSGFFPNLTYPNSKSLDVTLRYELAEMDIVTVENSANVVVNIADELKRRLTVTNPLRTIDTTATVEVTMIDHGFSGGESITIEEASAVGGISASNLNGSRTVGDIIDDNTFTFTAGGNANTSEDGGGNVKIVTHAPINTWDEQAFSAARGYPAAVTFHENRLVFGGTIAEPDTIYMSQTAKFFNFDVGEAADTDAIVLTAATGDVNEIRYLVSNRDLQVFTAHGELYVPTYLNQAITPTNAQIRKQTPYGCEFVQPASIDGATIFAQHDGKIIREYLYTDSEDAYTASSISSLASHIIDTPKYLTVAHSGFDLPDSYAALTLDNGDMALFTSNRAEKRAAWTRVTTNGLFSSVVAVHGRLFANVYYDDQLHLCEFDSEIGMDKWILVTISSDAADVSAAFSDGDVVQVLHSDGTYIGDKTVDSSNEIDLTGYTGNVYVGLKYTTKLVTNPIDANMGGGPATGEVRGITNVVVDVKSTESMDVNSNTIIESSFTGKKEVRLLGYNRNPQVTIEQDKPLPMQVNGIVAELIV